MKVPAVLAWKSNIFCSTTQGSSQARDWGRWQKPQMAADGPALHVYPIEKTDNYVDRPENFTPNESEF
jgi:hypothetical protein